MRSSNEFGKSTLNMTYVGTALTYIDAENGEEALFLFDPSSGDETGVLQQVGPGGCRLTRQTVANDGPNRTNPSEDGSDMLVAQGWETTLIVPEGMTVTSLRDLFVLQGDADFTWLPHLAPRDDMLIGDMVFRSPALVLADAGTATALVPDLDFLQQTPGRLPAVMDFDRRGLESPSMLGASWSPKASSVEADETRRALINRWSTATKGVKPAFYIGYAPYAATHEHVYFMRDREASLKIVDGRLVLRYDLLTMAVEKPHASLAAVSGYLWHRYGAGRMPESLLARGAQPPFANGARRATGAVAQEAKGSPTSTDGFVQFAPFETYAGYAYDWAFDRWRDVCWHEFDLNGERVGSVVFIVTAQQSPNNPGETGWREMKSIWNQAWFSSLRSAYGYYAWGKRWNRPDLIDRANLAKAFALAAPQHDGLFPGYYVAGEDGSWETGRWVRSSNRKPADHDGHYHLLDTSWTALWMLRWYRDHDRDERLFRYVQRYIDRLRSLQLPSGAFPSWIDGDTGDISPYLRESPQTAMHVLLLSEWAMLLRSEGDEDDGSGGALAGHAWPIPQDEREEAARVAMDAAKRGADYLIADPIPQGRWEDFETYWSCSRQWELKRYGVRDEKSGLYAQCSFSIYWTAEAMVALYEATGDVTYLHTGVDVLGELSLYQQVWDPPFVDIPAFGGFGVMNTDGEWNDARQSLVAPTYLRYYRHTGDEEHFERGVAALRAAFVMMYAPENETVKALYDHVHPHFGPEDVGFCMENFAHGGVAGTDGIGEFTIFDWGPGSASASAAMVYDAFGDVFVDESRRQAFGINGCTAVWTDDGVQIQEWLGRDRTLRVVRRGVKAAGQRDASGAFHDRAEAVQTVAVRAYEVKTIPAEG